MIYSGNQGCVEVRGEVAVKRYHDSAWYSGARFFRREVCNLRRTRRFRGTLCGFQIPRLISYSAEDLSIVMTSVDLVRPYIVDLCPMITEECIFRRFILDHFYPYVSEEHGVGAGSSSVEALREALLILAEECWIYYTDPSSTNVGLGV